MTATHWFFGLIALTTALFLLAYFLPKNRLAPSSDNLSNLLALTNGLLDSSYHIELSERYVGISKHNQKIALLTLDAKLANGVRRMGNTLIINFNKLPNQQLLLNTLKEQGILHYH